MKVQINRSAKELIGMDDVVARLLTAVRVNHPVLLYGPTGSGKTMMAWAIAEQYAESKKAAEDVELPIIYLQLYPEMTKNSLIGGETLRDGNIVVETQSVINFGCKGAIFVVDECTHTTEPVLLAFNSLIEEPYSTVVGSAIYELNPNTRFIFCGNYPDHAGNIPLPISFANRLYIENVSLPSKESLMEIGKTVSSKLPDGVLEFLANVIVKTHDSSFPISPRNMILCCRSLESLLGSGYSKSNNKIPVALDKELKALKISPDKFKFIVLSTFMSHVHTKSEGPMKVQALLW